VGRKRKEGRAKMVLKRELTESVRALGRVPPDLLAAHEPQLTLY